MSYNCNAALSPEAAENGNADSVATTVSPDFMAEMVVATAVTVVVTAIVAFATAISDSQWS